MSDIKRGLRVVEMEEWAAIRGVSGPSVYVMLRLAGSDGDTDVRVVVPSIEADALHIGSFLNMTITEASR